MTTTELINLLKKYEHGGVTGRPRNVYICADNKIYSMNPVGISTGDGICGAELFLSLEEGDDD